MLDLLNVGNMVEARKFIWSGSAMCGRGASERGSGSLYVNLVFCDEVRAWTSRSANKNLTPSPWHAASKLFESVMMPDARSWRCNRG